MVEVERTVMHGIQTLRVRLGEGEEALVVSDTHFGLRVRGVLQTDYRGLAEMLSRLAEEGRNIKAVILLGDIFELWTGRLGDILATGYDFLRRLAGLDATVIYVSGNHDRVISNISLRSELGLGDLYIVPDFVVLESGGGRVVLLHGHQFDGLFSATKGLWRIQSYIYALSEALIALPGPLEWFMAILSAALVFVIFSVAYPPHMSELAALYAAAVFLLAPLIILVWRELQGRVWYLFLVPLSGIMKGRSRGKSIDDMVAKKSFKNTVSVLKEITGGFGGLVFGHTHVPGLKRTQGLLVANTGSWVISESEHDTYVVIGDGSMSLYRWAGEPLLVTSQTFTGRHVNK